MWADLTWVTWEELTDGHRAANLLERASRFVPVAQLGPYPSSPQINREAKERLGLERGEMAERAMATELSSSTHCTSIGMGPEALIRRVGAIDR
jgi:hypothetical protein